MVSVVPCVTVVQGQDGWGVTYNPTQICATEGSTVTIKCTYTYPSRFKGSRITVVEMFWFNKMNGDEPEALKKESWSRVQYLYYRKSCTLKIKNVIQSDSGVYKFRFTTNHPDGKYIGEPGVILSVTGKIFIHVRYSKIFI